MDFSLHENICTKTVQLILDKNYIRIEKVKKLCEFIQVEEGLSDEDKTLLNHINKQLNYLANLSIDALKLTCKDISPKKEIIFKVCKIDLLEVLEGVIGIYGYMSESFPNEEPEINMNKLPHFVNSNERIILLLDIFHGVRTIPWKHQ